MYKRMAVQTALAVSLAVVLFAGETLAAFTMPKVDPRAVKSGIYIQPRKEAQKAEVTFTVTEPSGVARKNYPVRGGIPMFRGELRDTSRIALIDDKGKRVPVQGKATAFWPEGTAKFLCIDFLVDLKAGETKKFTLQFGASLPPYGEGAIKTTASGKTVTVNTGRLEISFSPGKAFSSAVKVDGKEVTREALTGFLTLSEGSPKSAPKAYPLTIDAVKVEERGPVQTTIYLKGRYGDKKSKSPIKWQRKYDRFVFHGFVRLYAGSARMDVTHSFGFNGNEHKEFVRRYGITVPLKAAKGKFTFGKSMTESASTALSGDLLLAQPHHSNWKLSGAAPMNGKRLGGWASVSGQGASALIGLRNAWQQWPVSFRANVQGDLSVDIHGGEDSNFLDLRYTEKESGPEWYRPDPKKKYSKEAPRHLSKSMYVGEKLSTHYMAQAQYKAAGILKISELVIDFAPGADAANVGQTHHRMLVPWPGKERFADTRVFGLTGYFPDNAGLEKQFNFHARNIVDLPLVQHEANGLYGWVDYPDGLDIRPPKKGETRFNTDKFLGGEAWNNGEKSNQAVVSLYAASGWRRALDYGHQVLLHTMGIDVEHKGGDQATGITHRHCQVHWGTSGSPRQCGAYIGWYWYYWISGHNEIGRSLGSVWENPLGLHHKNGAKAEWPHHPGNALEKSFILPKGAKTAIAYAAKGSIYHWVNFNRWQTTGDTRFVNYLDSLYHGLTKNPYKLKKKTKKTYPNRLKVSLIDDTAYPGSKVDPPKPGVLTKPHFYNYYFMSYYGKALITEWAALTGSKHAVDLLLMMGDWDWDKSTKVVASSRYKDKIVWLYRSHGQYMAAYYLLRGQDPKYQDQIQRMLGLIQARTTRPQNTMGEVPAPENYTAKEWMKAFKPSPWNCKPWGKNGLKNIGGHMNAVYWNLWFYRDINQKQIPQKHKDILKPHTKRKR